MSTESHVGELDKLVTGRLVSTLRAHGRSTRPPIEFRLLIRQLACHVERKHPFEIACDCALLGELIFASGRGGIYQLTDSGDTDERRVHEPLLALRNACFHPGNFGGLLSLSNDLARWAIQQAHAVGRFELMAIGRWWPTPL